MWQSICFCKKTIKLNLLFDYYAILCEQILSKIVQYTLQFLPLFCFYNEYLFLIIKKIIKNNTNRKKEIKGLNNIKLK